MKLKKFLIKSPYFKSIVNIYYKIVSHKNKFVSAMFYCLKVFIETTSILLLIPFITNTFPRDQNINYERPLFLFIGKYVNPRKKIYHFDYYHFGLPLTSFLKTRNFNYREYYYEESSLLKVIMRTNTLIQNKPRILIFSSWNPYSRKLSHPSKFYIRMIKRLLNDLTINLISWDTTSIGFWEDHILNESWVKIIITENPMLSGLQNQLAIKSNIMKILMPLNYDALNKTKSDSRSIDVFFSGKINSYRDYRQPYINSIKSIKYNLYLNLVNSNEDLLHYEEIYSKLHKSKIGINFSTSANHSQQLKGRVWETLLCGALLLEQKNEQILEYFEPDIDFVFFSTPLELKEKILFFLNNPLELDKIALNGNIKARSLQKNNRYGYIFD